MHEEKRQILLEALKSLDFVSFLNMEKLESSLDAFEDIQVTKGAQILGAGKVGKSFIIVGEGKVSARRETAGEKGIKVCEFGPGSYFGEDSLLLEIPRTVSFQADEDTLLFFLKKGKFDSLFISIPQVSDFLEKKAHHRLLNVYELETQGIDECSAKDDEETVESAAIPPAAEEAPEEHSGREESPEEPVDDTPERSQRDKATIIPDESSDTAAPGVTAGDDHVTIIPDTGEAEAGHASQESPPKQKIKVVPVALDELEAELSDIQDEIPRPAPALEKPLVSTPTIFFGETELKELQIQSGSLEEAFMRLRSGTLLPEDDMELYKKIFRSTVVKKGFKILTAGRKDENFYLIGKGKVVFKENDAVKLILGPGHHFGEISILYNEPRTTDCEAEEDVTLYRMSRDNFFRYFVVDSDAERLLKTTSLDIIPGISLDQSRFPGQEWLKKLAIPLRDFEEKKFRNSINRMSFYKYLSEGDLAQARNSIYRLDVSKNTVILNEGAISSYFFIVAEGKVKVTRKDEKEHTEILDEFTRGDYFGEDSLISHEGVYGACVASENTRLYIIGKRDFFRYFAANPDVEAIITLSARDRAGKKRMEKAAAKVEALPLSQEDYPLLEETIRKLPYSRYFTDEHIEPLKKAFKKLSVEKETKILGRGKKGNAFIIVAKGKVSVRVAGGTGPPIEQATLGQAEFFGEESLLLDEPRTTDFWARENTILLYISRDNFLKYFLVHSDVTQMLKESGEFRLRWGYARDREQEIPESWVRLNSLSISDRLAPLFNDTLKKFEYSRHLKKEEIIALRNFFRVYPAQKGTQIVQYGTKGEYFFLIARGKVALKKFTTTGQEISALELGPGDYFGEYALLKDVPREVNYVAQSSCVLFCIKKKDFMEILLSNQMVKQLINRKAEEKRRLALKRQELEKPKQAFEKKEKIILPEDLEGAMNALKNARFFKFMNKQYLETLLPQLVAIKYSPGAEIPMEEEKAFYLIASGKIAVMGKDSGGDTQKVQHLSPGEWFGENELMEKEHEKRKYYSDGMSILFTLSAEHFSHFIEVDLSAKYYLEKSIRFKNGVFERKCHAREKRWKDASERGKGSVFFARLRYGLAHNLFIPLFSLFSFLLFLKKNMAPFSLILLIFISELYEPLYTGFHYLKGRLSSVMGTTKKQMEALAKAQARSISETSRDLQLKVAPPEKLRCNATNLSIITRQMGIMLNVGVGLKKAFAILLEQIVDKNLKIALSSIEYDVINRGMPISMGMRRFPSMFSDLYVSLIRSGEVSGELGNAFLTCAEYIEKETQLLKKLGTAMVYPIINIICCMLLLIGISLFVMPTFVAMFEAMKMTLPITTQLLIFLVKGIRNPFIVVGMIIVLLIMVNTFRLYYRSVEGRRFVDALSLKIIGFGEIIRKVIITRFSWTLSGLLNGGIPLLESLRTSESTITNMHMKEQIQYCRHQIMEGKSLTKAFQRLDIFPRMFKDMVMVGEETGNLADQLKKIGDCYDQEINYAIEGISSMIEPMMMMFIGLAIGFVLVSLFLPMYQIIAAF